MGSKTFSRGDIIFRQGDPGDCMYDIQFGTVDIYVNYGGDNEQKVAELTAGELFGEMSILDSSPRSATAVAGADGAEVTAVSKKDFVQFFLREPAKILSLMQQMSDRVTKTTQDYLEACQTVYELQVAGKDGAAKDENLQARIRKYSKMHKDFNSYANS